MIKPPLLHILEPTVRSIYGHHFRYCEMAADYFALRGYDSICYFSVEGASDSELRYRAPAAKYVFGFRFSRAFDRNYGGEITDEDVLERRGMQEAKRAAASLVSDGSITSENLIWRLRYDLDTVAAGYSLSAAEREVVRLAVTDLEHMAQFLRVNHRRNENILFLPTGEYFLLRALIANLPAFSGLVSQMHIRLWNFLSLEKNGADCAALAIELQRTAEGHGIKIHLYAEAPWACDHLTRVSGTKAGYLDINSFADIVGGGAARQADIRATQPRQDDLRVFFPGAYRRYPDKGLVFVNELLSRIPVVTGLRLMIQAPDYAALRLNEAFVKSHPAVTLLPRILDDAVYESEFRNADLICVPYDDVTWPDRYRGSGVIYEAFLSARPVAVAQRTPLAYYAGDYSLNMIDGVDDFLNLTGSFDRASQERAASANGRQYMKLLAVNDMLALLPPPVRSPVLV